MVELRMFRALQFAAAGATLVLAGCGGGGSDVAAGGSSPSSAAPSMPGVPTAVVAAPATPAASAAADAAAVAGTPAAPELAQSAPLTEFLDIDPAHPQDYTPRLPAYYDAAVAALDNAAASNPASNATATLGRVLFHDRRLSVNESVSCASCHQQSTDFGDAARFSTGFDGSTGTMHAMRLANLRYWQPGTMFWDRRAPSLEAQSTQPIQNPVEMGFDRAHGGMVSLIGKMAGLAYYQPLFTAAFGDTQITDERIQKALAQYTRSMVSTSSRWDEGYAQTYDPALPDKGVDKDVPGLTAQENRGRHLFMALPSAGGLACATCHVPPTFALAATSRGNGLDAGESTVFKSPSLKNVAKSSTFMHDGRFSSLEEVVDHYASGVKDGPALDPRLKGPDGQPRVRNITPDDKAALVAFLKTLSDPVLANDPRFTDPFRH